MMGEAALALGTHPSGRRLEAVHLMGAAIDNDHDARPFEYTVSGTVYDYWSRDDGVLNRRK